VGATTWNDLLSRSQVRYGDRNDCVKALQVQLNTYREDTHTGDLPITGYFGPKTRTALHNFQVWRHRPSTDTVDVATWHTLLTSGVGE
jgi:peptidoglycan hydrolase-like protein with peptidoglycan-binding domain